MCRMIFGITGATGTGKSTVSEIFRELGVDVVDADYAAREVVKRGSACLAEIVDAFGDGVLLENGELDRRGLGALVFSDSEKLAVLTRITHHYIREYVLERLRTSKSDICAIDGAVLIGSNMEELCRLMVVVCADDDVRRERITRRDGLSYAEAELRMQSQESAEFYRSHSDYIIENNGSREELAEGTRNIFNRIKERAGY